MQTLELQNACALASFIDSSPTPYHAVHEMKRRLKPAGFRELSFGEDWNLAPGDRCMISRNGSSLAAFIVGSEPPFESGFKIIGAHTDSPNLRLKPKAVFEKSGYVQLGVEVYGGALLNSWLNRDLTLAGRLVVRGTNKELTTRLVTMEGPILTIPQLAIHLDREVNEKGLVLDKQKHLAPILALANTMPSVDRFYELLRAEGSIKNDEEIVTFDLSLCDVASASIGGLDDEFIFAPRLDNLASCHAAITALVATNNVRSTCVVACYDNEEVGSQTAQGAQSPFLRDVLIRMSSGDLPRAISKSFCVSADMAHAFHPNFEEKFEPQHAPIIGGGPVIKMNVNQRYASTDLSTAFFAEVCKDAGTKFQNFVMRSNMACGTTIGPITSAELGIDTVDVGNPLASMHSIREMAGVSDHRAMILALGSYLSDRVPLPNR